MIRRGFRYFFRRDEADDLDPKMYMRGRADRGAEASETVVLGRGRDRYVRTPGSSRQRATVKTTVVAAAKAKAHARYLQKEAAGLDGADVQGFTATADKADLTAVVKGWSEDRHYFQIILSPEHGGRLDMVRYTRSVAARWERDLETSLTWVAVLHYDTKHPHAHVMLRGRDDRDGDLVIDRGYIRHGMRARAMEAATQALGPRSVREIAAVLETRRRDLEAGLPPGLGKAAGWQLHLNVPAERRHPTTRAVLADLTDRGLPYHMRFGAGKAGRLTVSVGPYDDAVRAAQDLDGKFGHQLRDLTGRVARDDVRLAGPVWGAFDPQGDRDFTRWTVKGVPLDREEARDLRTLDGPAREARRFELRAAADAKLMERYGDFYAGTERMRALERLQGLQRDLGHGY